MTQSERVLAYIQRFGSITQIDALREFGCMRLASRISDLKNSSYNITRKMEQSKNRYGEAVSYARYYIQEANDGRTEDALTQDNR